MTLSVARLETLTRSDIEEFLYREAELLDAWDLDAWLTLWRLDQHTRYVVPCNDTPDGDPTQDLVLIDDDELRLRMRVDRLNSRKAHREYPHSRTNHQILNVRLGAVTESSGSGSSGSGSSGSATGAGSASEAVLPVRASFTVWRFRNGKAATYVGRHHYRLVAGSDGPLIRSKRVVLDMTELRPAADLAIIL
jgi:p-cumate 2,3-dioxygenase beta subunit